MTQMTKSSFKELRLILGDQLNMEHSWYRNRSDDVLYVMMEIRPESEYVTHHIQKVVGIFLAMRNFSQLLKQNGHHVQYFEIDNPLNLHSFSCNCQMLIQHHEITKLSYQEPDEYRLDQLFLNEFSTIIADVNRVSSEHFFTERTELANFFKGKMYVMENFYRHLRRKHCVLMDGDTPATGTWNYDNQNRKKLPKGQVMYPPFGFSKNVSSIIKQVESAQLLTIGFIDQEFFLWPTNREESIALLQYFIEHLLPYFGDFQDAMSTSDWSLFHSRLSFALNTKMISPSLVVLKVEQAWRANTSKISISQAEGFIRQVLGWREYMRGVYWAKMPDFKHLNYFKNRQQLPAFYWTGETKMRCMSLAIRQSLDLAYAHHIQRLMVTGNFALLAGVNPDEVDAWYLGIYIDAFEWVEITNTRGMSQYADGGIVGTKPYISSGAYINKMSDYCKGCYYDVSLKYGERACPFNSLYWSFLDEHQGLLASNQRMSMMYAVWAKMNPQEKKLILEHAEGLRGKLDKL